MRHSLLVVVIALGLFVVSVAEGQLVFSDGSQQSSAGAVYTHTVVVNPSGTDTQNGTALLNALGAISGNTSTNRFLLQLEPGIYNLGASSLTLKSWVDIHGSGLTNTIITGNGATTVNAVADGFLRYAAVQNTGSSSVVYSVSGVSSELFRVSLSHLGTSGTNATVSVTSAGSLSLQNCAVSATTASTGSNTGILVSGVGSNVDLRSASVTVSGSSTSNVGVDLASNTAAALAFAQIDLSGTGATGVSIVSDGFAQFFTSSVISSGEAFDNAGTVAAATTLFSGGRTNTGTVIYVHCMTGLFGPISDSLSPTP